MAYCLYDAIPISEPMTYHQLDPRKQIPAAFKNKKDGFSRMAADRVQGPVSIYRPYFPGMGIPMLKIRRLRDCLIFNMGTSILVRRYLYNEMPPSCLIGVTHAYYLC